MKHLLKLLLIAVIAMPLGMQISAQEVAKVNAGGQSEQVKVAAKAVDLPAVETDKALPLQDESMATEAIDATETVAMGKPRTRLSKEASSEGRSSVTNKAPMRADVVTPPSGLTIEDWAIATNFYNVGYGDFISFGEGVKVAIDESNNKIYVQGLDLWIPNAWVEGTFDGTTATFPTGQYFGQDSDGNADYFVGYDNFNQTTCDIVFTYNSSTKNFKLNDDLMIEIAQTANGGYWGYHINTVFAKEYVEALPPAVVGEGSGVSAYIPIYGYYYDLSTTSQIIYPASMLSIEPGRKIKSVTFHVSTNGGIQFSGGEITVTLGTTANTYFPGNNALTISGTTTTAKVVPTQYSNTLKIEFDTPFEYTAGANLIIQLVNTTTGNDARMNWQGVQYNNGNTYYSYSSRGDGASSPRRLRFMPKTTFEFVPEVIVLTGELDFGCVEVGYPKTLDANIDVASVEGVTASVGAPFTAGNPVAAGNASGSVVKVPVTFTPTDANVFNSTLTVDLGDGTQVTIPVKGIGTQSGTIATRDREFFEGITYNWKDSLGVSHKSNLGEIATDPDQIIAMLREVYMNRTIPGNYKRGYASSGTSYFGTHDNNVQYGGAGTIDSNHNYVDTYGWNIPGSIKDGSYTYDSETYNYWYMNPEQYKPYNEGLTLLLLEIQDKFSPADITVDGEVVLPATPFDSNKTGYEQLRQYFTRTIKSARVVTEAKRTGTGEAAGTMFKLDCDKMNKFYLIAKGQLQWLKSVWYEYRNTTYYGNYKYSSVFNNLPYTEPCFITSTYNSSLFNKYVDPALHTYFFLGHMFEQFSPAVGDGEETLSDGYQKFVLDMESFGVIHDCPNVPFVNNGHHFMMYGPDSEADDCQDIRDMMFFVPDYRMMDWSGRGRYGYTNNTGLMQDYFFYHQDHVPSIGVFVIKQNTIPEGTANTSYRDPNNPEVTGLYKHQLQWKSNLDKFLPGDEQYYELWEIVVDEFGVESYQPVYKRNADGSYVLENGEKVPVILPRETLATNQEWFTYTDVYVDMKSGSQTKTYVIRGRDADDAEGKHFLNLQMSNPEEIFIPGTDPNEKAHMVGATYYSRYNAKTQKNCYSNKIELTNNGMTLTAADMANGMTFYRSSRSIKINDEGIVETDDEGNIVYESHKEAIATGTASNGVLTITLDKQSLAGEYPNGETSGTSVGYHANTVNTNGKLTFAYSIVNGKVQFTNGFKFWDNFTVEVDKNAHPLQYLYNMEIGDAYSNNVRVPVYKTDSRINGSFFKDEVDFDGYKLSENGEPLYVDGKLVSANIPSMEVSEDVEFESQVQLSSKQDILRYDAYRWSDAEIAQLTEAHSQGITIIEDVINGKEEDVDPTGMASNAGDYYTVTMNKKSEPQYYYSVPEEDQPQVSTTAPINWANFIDRYPRMQISANEYLYAPVVELFTRGYKEQLDNQGNKVKRDDYNSYGGPQQTTAIGKFELVDKDNVTYNMSEYSWPGARNLPQYSYYNVYLNFMNAAVPTGYELYKVRAWRQAKTDLLGEQDTPNADDPTPDYNYRKGTPIEGTDMSSYMFEDVTFGETIKDVKYENGNPTIVESTPCHIGNTNTDHGILDYYIGKRLEVDSEGEPVATNVWKCTFGARRVAGAAGEEDWNTVPELPLKFIVRAYFTRTGNITGAKAGEADGKYYIVEQVVEPVIKYNSEIVTGVKEVTMNKQVVGVTYYNATGMSSNEPFDGINIVVTHYNDGTSSTTKVLK